jgi:hypothetical protein
MSVILVTLIVIALAVAVADGFALCAIERIRRMFA